MPESKVESEGPERQTGWSEGGKTTLGDLLGEAGVARMRTSVTGGGPGGGGNGPSAPTIDPEKEVRSEETEKIVIDVEDPEGTARSLDSFILKTEKEMRELGATASLDTLKGASEKIKNLTMAMATEPDPSKIETLETELDGARDLLMEEIGKMIPHEGSPEPQKPATPPPQKKRRISAAEVAAIQRAAAAKQAEASVPPYIEKPYDGIVLRHKKSVKITPDLDQISTFEGRLSKKMQQLRSKMGGVSFPPSLEAAYADRSSKLWRLAEQAYAERNPSAQKSLSQQARELVADIEENILPQVERHIREAKGEAEPSGVDVSTSSQKAQVAQVRKPVLNMPMKAPSPSSSPSEEPAVDLTKSEEGVLADAWEKQGWGSRSATTPASTPTSAPTSAPTPSSPATTPPVPAPLNEKIMAPGDLGHMPEGGLQGGNLEIFTNKARDAYIARYQHYMRYEQSGMRRLRNLVGSPHKESSLPPELRELREKYEEEVSRFAHNYSETRKRELEAHGYRKEDIDKTVRMETFQRFVIGEQLQLQKAKAESLPPRKESLVKRAFKWYGSLPLWARASISTAAITGLTFATGGIATAAGIGAFAGVGFARAFAGGLVAQAAGAFYEGSVGKLVRARAERRQSAAQEALGSSFAFGNKEEVRRALDQYTAILAQKEKSEKWLRRGKILTMVGAGFGTAMSTNVAAALASSQEAVASGFQSNSGTPEDAPADPHDPAQIAVPQYYDPYSSYNPYDSSVNAPASGDLPPMQDFGNHPPASFAVEQPSASAVDPNDPANIEVPRYYDPYDASSTNPPASGDHPPVSLAEAGSPDFDAGPGGKAFPKGFFNAEAEFEQPNAPGEPSVPEDNEALPAESPVRSHAIAQGGSKWASVREIFKANAAEFGYDANGKVPLDKWAETQTANLMKANPEFAKLNRVYEGDVVTLQKGPDGLRVGFETNNPWSLKAGVLESRGAKLPEAGVVDSGGGTSPEATPSPETPSAPEASPRLSEADLSRVVDTNVRAWVNNEWSSRGLWGIGKSVGIESPAWTEYRGMSLKNLESLKNQIRAPGEAVTWWSNIQGLSRETGIPVDPNSTVEQYLRSALKQRIVGQLGETAPSGASTPGSSAASLPRGTRAA